MTKIPGRKRYNHVRRFIHKYRSAVFNERRMDVDMKAVLLAVAEFADEHGYGAYPAVDNICLMVSMGHRRVRKVLDDAATFGALGRCKIGSGHGWNGTDYQLTLWPGAETTPARLRNWKRERPVVSNRTLGAQKETERPVGYEPTNTADGLNRPRASQNVGLYPTVEIGTQDSQKMGSGVLLERFKKIGGNPNTFRMAASVYPNDAIAAAIKAMESDNTDASKFVAYLKREASF